jgi:hypothetical protein
MVRQHKPDEPKTGAIHRQIGAVLAEISPIVMRRWNAERNLDHGVIDNIVLAFPPLMAKHGVFVVSEVVAKQVNLVDDFGAGASRVEDKSVRVLLTVKYSAHSSHDGSCVVVGSVAGEGRNVSDKVATSQALDMAYRSMVLQFLGIPVGEPDEATPDGR